MKWFDWFDRWRRHVREARELYEPMHDWTVIADRWQIHVFTTRIRALEYVKDVLGMHVGMVDDERFEILCEHPKGRKISDADSQH